MSRYYVDSSALLKLVAVEPESGAFSAFVAGSALVSSELLLAEVARVARKLDLPERAELVLRSVTVVALTTTLLRASAQVGPPELRALHAIHLVTALHLRNESDGVLVYDQRLAVTARAAGLEVFAPGT